MVNLSVYLLVFTYLPLYFPQCIFNPFEGPVWIRDVKLKFFLDGVPFKPILSWEKERIFLPIRVTYDIHPSWISYCFWLFEPIFRFYFWGSWKVVRNCALGNYGYAVIWNSNIYKHGQCTEDPCLMQISLVWISLLRFFKTFRYIQLMQFLANFISLLQFLRQKIAKKLHKWIAVMK